MPSLYEQVLELQQRLGRLAGEPDAVLWAQLAEGMPEAPAGTDASVNGRWAATLFNVEHFMRLIRQRLGVTLTGVNSFEFEGGAIDPNTGQVINRVHVKHE